MTKTMTVAMTLATGLLLVLAVQPRESAAAEKGGYRVGDRLPKSSAVPGGKSAAFKEINWDSLMPANWNPMKGFDAMNLGAMNDGDPRAQKALDAMREAWNNAPVDPALNGTRVRIAGFVVPLEGQKGQVSEFLLVPYFGACIHTPPPPSNQIIHVNPAQPLKSELAADAVWVSGVIETVRSDTGMGSAGYRMKAESIAPFRNR